MSYQTVGYGINLETLAQAKGCGDQTLLAAVLATSESRVQSHNEWDPADPRHDVISLVEALEDLIGGKLREPSANSAFQYLYALELLCIHLGTELEGGDSIGDVENVCWDTGLRELRIPLDLPASLDFPSVSHLTASEVKKEYEQFDAAHADSADDLDNATADAREDFLWWLKQCADRSLGIVTFCY